METLASEASRAPSTDRLMNAALLQHWSSPKVMLVVTDIADEKSLQFHAIQHARQSGSKVLLVQVGSTQPGATTWNPAENGVQSMACAPAVPCAAERMARRLRLSGIQSEPVMARNLRVDDIPFIVRSYEADRVLVSAPIETSTSDRSDELAYQLIDLLEVPVCIVERRVPLISRYQRPSRRITLVLSLHARNELPIAFASRFAQENHSQLTIMQILPKGYKGGRRRRPANARFISQLPSSVLREAEQMCPLQFVVEQGDSITEILNYDSQFNQDFWLLAPSREAGPLDFGVSTVQKIIWNAPCPVIVLKGIPDAQYEFRGSASAVYGTNRLHAFLLGIAEGSKY